MSSGALAPSAQMHSALPFPPRAYVPVLQGAPGLPTHAVPSAHAVHAPAPSQKPPVHGVPRSLFAPSSQDRPPSPKHVVAPCLHSVGLVPHACPPVQVAASASPPPSTPASASEFPESETPPDD